MKSYPRMRRDHLCALKSCRKKLTRLTVDRGDPFHSSECCKAYYGVRFGNDVKAERYTGNRGKKALA